MSLLIVRHGETALNAARILQPADTALSARGLAQAEALARRIASLGAVAVVSSDLPRALRTAEAIAAVIGAPVEVTPLLQERNYGALRGLPYDALPRDPLTMREAPPQGESAEAFEHRVALAFAHVARRRAALAGNLVVVTHGLVVREIIARHLHVPPGLEVPARLSNTGLSIAEAQPPHRATLLDCTRHLDAALGDDAAALSGG